MNNPKFEQKLHQKIIGPQRRQSAEHSSGYGVVLAYYAESNTADVIMSQKDSIDAGTTYRNVPCPTNIGVQGVAPEPGRPCFPAGTLVLTTEGLKPIELVVEGDLVLTHLNRWRPVLYSGKTGDSETITVSGRGAKITCTPDHRFLVSEVQKKIGIGYQRVGQSEWVQAKDTIGYAWGSPSRIEPLPIPLPEGWTEKALPSNFWWVIGRWVGDGWTSAKGPNGKRGGGSSRIIICCGKHEFEMLSDQLQLTGWNWRVYEDKTTFKFNLHDKSLRIWLRYHFGTKAQNKQVPSWLLGAPPEIRQSFLEGYVSADGCIVSPKRGRSFTSITTVSPSLAQGIRLLGITLGYSPVIQQWDQKTQFIMDRSVSSVQRPFQVRWPICKVDEKYSQAWDDESHQWGRVYDISLNTEVVPVYDIAVEEDHSFVADGIVVHNCWVDFKGNSDHYPIITTFFNHVYNKIDYTKQTTAINNTPRFMTQM